MKCDDCKKKTPNFVNIKKLKARDCLRFWYEWAGEWKECDAFTVIRKVEGDLIFHSVNKSVHVEIDTLQHFENCTFKS